MPTNCSRTLVSPEWELILLAVQPQPNARELQAIVSGSVQDSLDWNRCHRMAAAHGVSALVHRRLHPHIAAIPVPEIWDPWTAECEAESLRNLSRIIELRRVNEACEQRKIPLLVVKGPVLGACLYGDVALRPFGDLDLIVPVQERERAIECLSDLGFVPQFQLTPSERRRFFRRYSELHFTSATTGTMIDLHWELISQRYEFAHLLDGYWQRATTVQIGPMMLRTLSTHDLFVFLLLHAAKHEWRSLGWLVDLAWLEARQAQFDWNRLRDAAARLGISKIVHISRRLSERLFGAQGTSATGVPADRYDPLVEEILDGLSRDVAIIEPPHRWPWQRIYFRALDRIRDKLRYVYDILLAPTPLEWKTLPLPAGTTWLYPLIRVARLLIKYAFVRKPDAER